MSTKTLTFAQFAELMQLEASRGIINRNTFLQMITHNKLPRIIHDIRGAVRITVDRAEEGLEVTQYMTELAKEKICEPMA